MPDNVPACKVEAVERIGDTEMVVRGDEAAITPGAEYYKMEGKSPRLYVYNSNDSMIWDNIEITCYYNKASPSTHEGAGFVLGARSYHHLGEKNARHII